MMKKLILLITLTIILSCVSVIGSYSTANTEESCYEDVEERDDYALTIPTRIICNEEYADETYTLVVSDICLNQGEKNILREWCLTEEECEDISGEKGEVKFWGINSFNLNDHSLLYNIPYVDHECQNGCVMVTSMNGEYADFCMPDEFAKEPITYTFEDYKDEVDSEIRCIDGEKIEAPYHVSGSYDNDFNREEIEIQTQFPGNTYATNSLGTESGFKDWNDLCSVSNNQASTMTDRVFSIEGSPNILNEAIELNIEEYYCGSAHGSPAEYSDRAQTDYKVWSTDTQVGNVQADFAACQACVFVGDGQSDYCIFDIDEIEETMRNKAVQVTAPNKAECNDGIDNDGDGTVDYNRGNFGCCDVDADAHNINGKSSTGACESKAYSEITETWVNEGSITESECADIYGTGSESTTVATNTGSKSFFSRFFGYVVFGNAAKQLNEDGSVTKPNKDECNIDGDCEQRGKFGTECIDGECVTITSGSVEKPKKYGVWYDYDSDCSSSNDDEQGPIAAAAPQTTQTQQKTFFQKIFSGRK